MPRLEQRRAIGVNGPALFRADHVLRDPLPGDTSGIGKRIRIEQGQDALERIGLSLVRSGREQQKIRSSFGERAAQLHPRHLVRAAAQSVSLIHNDQIPSRYHEVVEVVPDCVPPPGPATSHGVSPRA